MTPHSATREVNAFLRERGLTEATGRVFSRRWSDRRDPPIMRTVIYMVDPARREEVIAALQERFPDITETYRFDRDDSVATYCAIGILRAGEEGS